MCLFIKRILSLLILLLVVSGCTNLDGVQSGDTSLEKKDYINALKHYNSALEQAFSTENKNIIQKKIQKTQFQLASHRLDMAEKVLKGEKIDQMTKLDSAIIILQEVEEWDDSQKRLAAGIKKYQEEKQILSGLLKNHTQEANKLIGLYKFNEALEDIELGLKQNSADTELQQQKETVQKMQKIYEDLKAALAKKNLVLAMSQLRHLKNKSPVKLIFNKIPLHSDFALLIKATLAILQRQGKWWRAYRILEEWDLDELKDTLQTIKKRGSVYYSNQVKFTRKHQYPYRNYLLIERASTLDPSNQDIFSLHRGAGDLVDKSMQSNIAIASFNSPSNDPDAGKQFSDSLISYLYQVLPYGINILEREKIDIVQREQGANTKNLAQLLGVDIIVSGAVSLFRVDRTVDERTAVAKMQTSEEVDYEKIRAMYGTDRANWPQKESQMPKKSTHINMKYKKGQAKLKGFSKVSVRIFDTKKGAIALVKDYEANVSHSCEFQDEVSEAGIEYIPISLPTETEAKEDMRKEIVKQIGKAVLQCFENRERRFLNEARFYLGRKERHRAFRPLAEGYYYCKKSKLFENDSSCQEIKSLINSNLD
ncbi:MAG: hypothetical protein D3903_08750 [Candidatus Electrothrix sp. GM3_4]|nr:hypothetical protein [Candidatus Electrothrix sp. GM3_4]